MKFDEWKAAKNAAKSERDKQLTEKQAEIDNAKEWLQKYLDMWNSDWKYRTPEYSNAIYNLRWRISVLSKEFTKLDNAAFEADNDTDSIVGKMERSVTTDKDWNKIWKKSGANE